MKGRLFHFFLEYPWPTLWVATLVTLLVLFATVQVGSSNSNAVEKHIDQTIANTVKQAQAQANAGQAKDIKDLHDALNKAVNGYVQECNQLHALGQSCPNLIIQLPPGE